MFGKPTPTAIRLMKERGITQCEVEGCDNFALEAHHCLYGKKKGHSELDMDENLCLVCEDCHSASGKAKSFEHKLYFWQVQCERFGHKHMVEWHNSVRLKKKEYAYK
jgi:hypothetical protein